MIGAIVGGLMATFILVLCCVGYRYRKRMALEREERAVLEAQQAKAMAMLEEEKALARKMVVATEGGVELPIERAIREVFERGDVTVVEDARFEGSANDMQSGQPVDAALGVCYYMGVPEREVLIGATKGIEAMRQEFDALLEEARRGGKADEIAQATICKECLEYVLDKASGDNGGKDFANGCRDCDKYGKLLPERTRRDGKGMRIGDFCEDEASKVAGLQQHHVAALRVYTTAAYGIINWRLRKPSGRHPLPVTVFLIGEGIRRLRAVGALHEAEQRRSAAAERSSAAESSGAGSPPGPAREPSAGSPPGPMKQQSTGVAGGKGRPQDLWRGMRDLRVNEAWLEAGGTENAPMSTTEDFKVAVEYAMRNAQSEDRLLLKVRTNSFMDRGASLRYLSAFPLEAEILYPPLTYLKPTDRRAEVTIIPSTISHSAAPDILIRDLVEPEAEPTAVGDERPLPAPTTADGEASPSLLERQILRLKRQLNFSSGASGGVSEPQLASTTGSVNAPLLAATAPAAAPGSAAQAGEASASAAPQAVVKFTIIEVEPKFGS